MDENGKHSKIRCAASGNKLIGINCPVKKLKSAVFAIRRPNM